MADMKNLIVGNTTYNIIDDEAFRIGGDAREGSSLYIGTSSPYTPSLQLKRQNASMLDLSVQDDGWLKLRNVPYVDGRDDWGNATTLWDVDMASLSYGGGLASGSGAKALTTTYSTNNYVNSTAFGRITAYRCGNMVIVYGNLTTTANLPYNTTVIIGKINLPRTAKQGSCGNFALKTNGNNSTTTSVSINIDTSGNISLYNYGAAASGWCRFCEVLVL